MVMSTLIPSTQAGWDPATGSTLECQLLQRRVVPRLLDALVRWQVRRLERQIAALAPDDLPLH
jgi:hypothetical protein